MASDCQSSPNHDTNNNDIADIDNMTIATKDNVQTKLDEEELINYAKVVILGASGVGKTSIIKVSSSSNPM